MKKAEIGRSFESSLQENYKLSRYQELHLREQRKILKNLHKENSMCIGSIDVQSTA